MASGMAPYPDVPFSLHLNPPSRLAMQGYSWGNPLSFAGWLEGIGATIRHIDAAA